MRSIRSILVALITWEARLMLARHKPHIIAVTGSVGKTTTKDAIFSVLSPSLHVRKSVKSFNSEIGVPLTILGLDNPWADPLLWLIALFRGLLRAVFAQEYPEWLVLEVGADRPGDIRTIARWLRPEIAVYTGVPEVPVHVEYFGSAEAVYKEKRSLAENLRSGGTLVINGDDSHAAEMRADFRGAAKTYGFGEKEDYYASHEEIAYKNERPCGMRFRINHEGGSSVPIEIAGALGRPRIYAALAALAVGDAVGVDLVSGAAALAGWEPPPGRMRLIEGAEGSTIIDDTYNSSPAAALAALDTLAELKGATRKIAILGDMLELGKFTAEAHRALGERAAKCADMLFTVGFRARTIGEAALDAGMPEANIREHEQDESLRAGKELRLELKAGDVVLVKGSQSMRMERTVSELMAKPEDAHDLLVRQDPEWLAKE